MQSIFVDRTIDPIRYAGDPGSGYRARGTATNASPYAWS